ncbi:MAG: NAD(+)/NADH kinase [Bacteroidales bacterium]|nr:NAD(+)/NADH kinase [Bacteroidales bacterium]
MKLALYIKKRSLAGDPRIDALRAELEEGGCEVAVVKARGDLVPGFDALLSLGGDGTFLSAARIVGDSGVPVLGVNFGRLGFLSEYKPEEVVKPLLAGEYTVEDRSLLRMEVEGSGVSDISLNEVAVHRKGAAVLGVDVTVDGESLPTCWADGFLVATSSGSTAYSLSVGGPICTPDARVLILAPIAPHNLNIRPIVVPDTTEVSLSFRSREEEVMVTMDNRVMALPVADRIKVSVAQFSLKSIRLYRSNFIQALKSKLFWGEDVRNL